MFLDSAALILAVTKQPGYEPVEEVLRLAETGKINVYVSILAYVEVRGHGLATPFDRDLDARVLAVIDSPKLVAVEFHRGLALRARRYTHEHGLKNWDAVQVASAVEASADVLMTSDRGFKHERMIDGVWIDVPYVPGDPTLFDGSGLDQ